MINIGDIFRRDTKQMLSINIGKPFLLQFAGAKIQTFSELAKNNFPRRAEVLSGNELYRVMKVANFLGSRYLLYCGCGWRRMGSLAVF